MNLKDFTQGIKILAPYYNDPDGSHIGAEHDQFFMFPTNKPVSKNDVETLINAGWWQEDAVLKSDFEFGPDGYDSDISWTCYI